MSELHTTLGEIGDAIALLGRQQASVIRLLATTMPGYSEEERETLRRDAEKTEDDLDALREKISRLVSDETVPG